MIECYSKLALTQVLLGIIIVQLHIDQDRYSNGQL